MEIPLQAQVGCTDGVCGRSVYVLINPVIDQVTHVVVREDSSPNTEYIVPVDVVSETIADTIQLSVMKAMGDTYRDAVFLNIDKHQIESLPTFPLHRRWS